METASHKFSIIMPVYNLEQYVAEALDSVLAQTNGDFECICIDDGSVDESSSILDAYASRDARIKVIHQANAGEGAARNAGLAHATGDWLVFLDGDDVLHPRTLEICRHGMTAYPEADAIRFDFSEFGEGECSSWMVRSGVEHSWRSVDCSGDLCGDCFMSGLTGHAYRRSAVKDIRFTDLCVGADRVYFAACLNRFRSIAVNDGCVLYGYRQRAGSAINSALTLKKALADIQWRFSVIQAWQKEHRVFSDGFKRWMSILVTESVESTFRNMGRNDRKALWSSWLENMGRLRRPEIFQGWWRLTIALVLMTRSYLAFRVCFEIPHRLKLAGVHR